VGEIVDEEDVEDRWAVRMDGWRWRRGLGMSCSSLLLFPTGFCSGESCPELCAQRTDEAEDLLSVREKMRRGPSAFSFVTVM